MARFNAIFVRLEGLDQSEVGQAFELAADTREAAIAEATSLWRPAGANYLKISMGDQVISWISLAQG